MFYILCVDYLLFSKVHLYRSVPLEERSRAVALVFGGLSIGSVLGYDLLFFQILMWWYILYFCNILEHMRTCYFIWFCTHSVIDIWSLSLFDWVWFILQTFIGSFLDPELWMGFCFLSIWRSWCSLVRTRYLFYLSRIPRCILFVLPVSTKWSC